MIGYGNEFITACRSRLRHRDNGSAPVSPRCMHLKTPEVVSPTSGSPLERDAPLPASGNPAESGLAEQVAIFPSKPQYAFPNTALFPLERSAIRLPRQF